MKVNLLTLTKRTTLTSVFLCSGVLLLSYTANRKAPLQKEEFHLYLLIGQSNMAGRGAVEAQDTVGDPRILSLNKDGNWEVAKEPLHSDKPRVAGVGPALSFARTMLSSLPAGARIGLIPAACGGSPIRVWSPGKYWDQTKSYPYDDAVKRTTLALRTGTLKGILWHQGSSDSGPASVAVYKSRLITLVENLRKDLEAPGVPFISGELGNLGGKHHAIDSILHQAKSDIPFYNVVTDAGITYNADSVHFDSRSQRMLGQRYATAMKSILSNHADD